MVHALRGAHPWLHARFGVKTLSGILFGPRRSRVNRVTGLGTWLRLPGARRHGRGAGRPPRSAGRGPAPRRRAVQPGERPVEGRRRQRRERDSACNYFLSQEVHKIVRFWLLTFCL